jgi:zinc/manganese transport system substrate-binding protein
VTHGSKAPARSLIPGRSGGQRLSGTTLALALAGALGLQACAPERPPEVIAADGVLCDISRRLAGDDLRVQCLLQPGDDPHQFRLTPQQSRELSQAKLVLINGYGLTPALAEQAKAVAVAERAVPNSPVLDAQPDDHGLAERGDGDRGRGDHGHGNRDPHVWHDPDQAIALVQEVARQLGQLKPAARSRIAARAQAMAATLQDLDGWNRRQLATMPAASPLATGHRGFASLARAYGLRELAVVDATSTSDSLRPQTFQAVVEQLRRERVPMLFAEQLPPGKALQRISSLSGVPMAPEALVADGLGPEANGSGNLMATLTANTCRIVNGLKGRCDQSSGQALVKRWQALH